MAPQQSSGTFADAARDGSTSTEVGPTTPSSLASFVDDACAASLDPSHASPQSCHPWSVEAVQAGARRVVAAVTDGSGPARRDGWLAVVGECQGLINVLTAVQDHAAAEVARREAVWLEDGTVGEVTHGLGRVTLDAADVVAPLLGASHAQAQRRVEQAVHVAAARLPVEADGEARPEPSGLGGLHVAMRAGRLDGYRAGVVAHELAECPAEVSVAVIAALDPHLDDDGPTLRRRARRMLARISPELLRQRALRARAETGLRRWVAEPGVDAWHGTFPSEDAAVAWAAIDRLAHDLVAAGTCSSVEQARGRALTDLVTGNATVDVQVVLTVPADTCVSAPTIVGTDPREPDGHDRTTRGAKGPTTSILEPILPSPFEAAQSGATTPDATALVINQPDPPQAELPSAATPTADRDRTLSRGADRAGTGTARTGLATEATSSAVAARDDDLVQVQGARPSEPLLVRRGWLRDHVTTGLAHDGRGRKRAQPRIAPCEANTGARVDPGDDLASSGYRPGTALVALVRSRDGRCRFPGCTVAARFCDLDHVRPWPTGSTRAANLLCLCRRHHRVKQSAGWAVSLARDGTATWSDPTDRIRTTWPLDALESLVLAIDTGPDGARGVDPPPQGRWSPSRTSGRPREGPAGTTRMAQLQAWSVVESHIELHLAHRPPHRRCTTAADLNAARTARSRRGLRAAALDPPPF